MKNLYLQYGDVVVTAGGKVEHLVLTYEDRYTPKITTSLYNRAVVYGNLLCPYRYTINGLVKYIKEVILHEENKQ